MTTIAPEQSVADFLKTQPNTADRLTSQTAVLDLTIRAAGFTKKVKSKEVIKDDGTNPERIKAIKELIDRKKALAEVNAHESQFTAWLGFRSVPCGMLRGGFKMVPLSRIDEVDRKLGVFRDERRALVRQYVIEPLEQLKEQAKEDLKDHYRESDYLSPAEIEAAFDVDWRWVAFSLPAALEEINLEIAKREAARRNVELEEAFDEIKGALREGFVDLVDHLRDSLEPAADGSRKRLFESTLVNLREFLNTFADRNLTNDVELAALVTKAKAVLNGTTLQDLKGKSDTPRTRVLAGLTALDSQLNGLAVTRTRQFATDEEI